VLQAELARYDRCGRSVGGLGSVHLVYRGLLAVGAPTLGRTLQAGTGSRPVHVRRRRRTIALKPPRPASMSAHPPGSGTGGSALATPLATVIV